MTRRERKGRKSGVDRARTKPSTSGARRPGSVPTDIPFAGPSAAALSRIEAIPLLFETSAGRSTATGRVVYDSWAEGAAPALRDATDGHVRRLRLAAGRVTLEILAERCRDRWEFTARVYRGGRVAHDCVLAVDRHRLLARTGGYYHWSGQAVPRALTLLSHGSNVAFERLSWK